MMDPFQVRLEFLGLLRRLTASQQSISKVVDYAIRHATLASDDIWDCILSECTKTTLNARLNILFLLDALLLHIVDPTGFSSSSASGGGASATASSSSSLSTANLAQAAMAYLGLAIRDINKMILEGVVPSENWDAVRLNASSTEKVLASWKRLDIFKRSTLDELIGELQARKMELSKLPSSVRSEFSKQDVLRRMEEDRERHKRLRERAWILPAKSFSDAMPASKTTLANPPRTVSLPRDQEVVEKEREATDALEVEFDYVWDNLSDLNEDDLEKIREDDFDWWGSRRDLLQAQEQNAKDEEAQKDAESKKRKAEESERYTYQNDHVRSDSRDSHQQKQRFDRPHYFNNNHSQSPNRPNPPPPPHPRSYGRPPRWSNHAR